MALVEFGFRQRIDASGTDEVAVLSLEQSKTREGYMCRPSAAAAGLETRLGRMILSVAMGLAGLFLVVSGNSFVSPGATGAGLIYPIGVYLMIASVVWLTALLRRPLELKVDRKGRTLQLIQSNLHGEETSCKTIRFEEVVDITLKENLASLDMQANAMNWDLGRIDVTWRDKKVTPMIVGDVAELEPLLQRLRREVGLA